MTDKYDAHFALNIKFEMTDEDYEYVDPIDTILSYIKKMNEVHNTVDFNLVKLFKNDKPLDLKDIKDLFLEYINKKVIANDK